jgi:hypothetical protein
MSNRVKLAALFGLLLVALVVVTTWYRSREASSVAAPAPTSAVAARLGASDNAALAFAAQETQPSTSPTPPPPSESEAEAASEPRPAAALAKPRATRANRPAKSKPQPVEDTPPDAPQAATEPAPPPPPPAPPAASVAPAPVGMLVCHHRNRVGSSLRLVKVTYVLDGAVVFTEEGDKLAQSRDLEAFSRKTSPGEHTMVVVAEFQGNGRGVFSYFDAYRYRAQSAQRFNVREAATTDLTVMLLEKAGPMTSFENRLGIAFKVN